MTSTRCANLVEMCRMDRGAEDVYKRQAEGIAGPVMNLVILGITGVCLGAGVLMSEFFGAKDGESLRRELATTVLSGTAACTVVALLGALFTPTILQACAVPREIFAITAIYLRITFLGAPFTCFYNALAAGFKSVGDALSLIHI